MASWSQQKPTPDSGFSNSAKGSRRTNVLPPSVEKAAPQLKVTRMLSPALADDASAMGET